MGAVKKVLALNVNGDITFCSAPEDQRGKRRCNHIAHQLDGEDGPDFLKRIAKEQEEAQNKRNDINNSFIPMDGTTITTKPYRMTKEEKEDLIKIENRMQLDQNIEGGFISLNEPLWNDMDKNYFSELSGIHKRNIESILHEESYIVLSSDDEHCRKYPVGKIISNESAENIYRKINNIEDNKVVKKDDCIEFFNNNNISLVTGVEGMNEFADEIYDFEATKDVFVLPYYMRIGSKKYTDDFGDEVEESISSDITTAYKYLLRTRKDPNRQQIAYEALLNNSSMNSDYARYTKGFKNKSLADEFVGKGGVFRACLSGSSVPYSGRAVITPELMPFGEAKIPSSMAIDLFKPTLLEQLSYEGKTVEEIDEWFHKYRKPQTEISKEDRGELERRISDRRVILNRQPSLHRSSLQSFRPRISGDCTIKVHPLYCDAFGADFDGDTMCAIAINQPSIVKIADRSIDAKLDLNTHKPRSMESSSIMPSKDALFGILSILERRSK